MIFGYFFEYLTIILQRNTSKKSERNGLMKAVVMAGGEGSRLRPLTCTVPKPMVRVMGKPIIGYILDLLRSHGVNEAAVTLGYLSDTIEKEYSDYAGIKLNMLREDEPLGTAGCVKRAAADFKEPFLVISGDAMCNFDLSKIMTFHKASGAKITIVASEASDPREYGIVKVDKENRVTGFVEKPSWTQAVSNLANSGVYIVNPECLELIPKGRSYDFAKDLFPMMLEREMPIYCYHTADYWCDVGNIDAYMKCQRDVFDGKMKAPSGMIADGVYVKDAMPSGDFSIIPPVYIGADVEIAEGAVIGPYAVIDDNCSVERNAKIRYSTVLENCWIGANASVTGALVCSGSALKTGASMFESSVAGSGSIIGAGAQVKPNVLVWPGKIIGGGSTVNSNIKYGSVRAEYLSRNGMDESSGTKLNAETCVRLGAAVGSTRNGKKAGIGFDGSKSAMAMQMAIMSGLIGAGSNIWSFGECFEAELNFLINICGLSAGLFVASKNGREIKICGEGGLSIPRHFERSIEAGMAKCEFHETEESEMKEISDMSSVKQLYKQELMKRAPYGLSGVSASVESENESINSLISGILEKLGVSENGNLVFKIDRSGTRLTASVNGENVSYEKLLAICCLNEMKNGRDIAVPYDAPMFLDELAQQHSRRVFRYLSTPADNSDSPARRLAAKQIFVRDALFLSVKLLSVMKERECDFEELLRELPDKYIARRTVSIGFSPSSLADLVGEEEIDLKNSLEGIRLIRSSGKLLIVPERSGETVKILAEADTMEAADELCADITELFNLAAEKINL